MSDSSYDAKHCTVYQLQPLEKVSSIIMRSLLFLFLSDMTLTSLQSESVMQIG